MDNKKAILIGIILLIAASVIIVMLMNSVQYERIEITPNGTSIDVPANQTEYKGNIDGVKIWNWEDGALLSYNSHAGNIPLTDVGFNGLEEIVKKGKMETVNNITCYVLDADELLQIRLFDIIQINYNGKFYFIPLSNETTHDEIIICSKDKNIALHMAESVKYKNVYPNKTYWENAKTQIEETGQDLLNKTNDITNNTNINNTKTQIEDMAGDFISKIPLK